MDKMKCDDNKQPELGMCMLLVLIVDQKHTEQARELLEEVGIMRSTAILARGSAKRGWLETLGIGDEEKVVMLGVIREALVYAAFKLLTEEFCLLCQGTGIVFTLPLLAHTGLKSLFRLHEKMHHHMTEDQRRHMKKKLLEIKEKSEMDQHSIDEIKKHIDPEEHVMLITIVNRGFSGEVIDAARDAGAQGATTLHGRGLGLGPHDVEKFVNIRVEQEKEVVLIIVKKSVARHVMENVNKVANLRTNAHGVSFALPVSEVFGLSPMDESHKDESDKA